MPISDKYKIIFIHIPKCAGISMWHALDLNISKENLISISAPVYQHMLPKELQEKHIDSERWNSYKKFTIIRNPYDRVISDYFWMKEHFPAIANGSLDDFISLREDVVKNNRYAENEYYDHFYPMYFYFKDIKYDDVIRFENIDEEYEILRLKYKIPNPLSKQNQSKRKEIVLTQKQKDRIYRLYEKDFIDFSYSKKFEISNTKINEENNLMASKKAKNTTIEKPSHISNLNLLNKISTTDVKIFWGKIDLLFSPENAATKSITLESVPRIVSLQIPRIENTHFIQLEIGHEIGLLNIHEIQIKDDFNTVVWRWNKYNTHHKKNLLLIENTSKWGNKTIQLATSDNPLFIFPIDHLQSNPTKNFTVELLLSEVDDTQLGVLNTITSPLSYFTEADVEKLRASLNTSNEENGLYINQIETAKKTINELKSIQTQTSKTLEEFTQKVTQIVSEKERLIKGNIELAKQLNIDNVQIAKLTSDNKQFLTENNSLSKQLEIDRAKIIDLVSEKEYIKGTFIAAQKQLTDFKLDLSNKDNDLALKNNIILDLEKRLTAIYNKLEILKRDSEKTISWYKNTYENRSLLGIIKDRLLKK